MRDAYERVSRVEAAREATGTGFDVVQLWPELFTGMSERSPATESVKRLPRIGMKGGRPTVPRSLTWWRARKVRSPAKRCSSVPFDAPQKRTSDRFHDVRIVLLPRTRTARLAGKERCATSST